MGWGCVRRGKSERMASNSFAGVRGRREGLSVVVMEVMPCIRNCVRASTRRMCFISTRRLKCRRKSAPKMGRSTSATMKTQRKVRRSPRLRVRERVP